MNYPDKYLLSKEQIERFWRLGKVCSNGCWEWSRRKTEKGYGLFEVSKWNRVANKKGKKKFRAHRLAYVLTFGIIDDGIHVCHSCDNKPCINPDHLFLGTWEVNNADAVAKGIQTPRSAYKRKVDILHLRHLGWSVKEVCKHLKISVKSYERLRSISWPPDVD